MSASVATKLEGFSKVLSTIGTLLGCLYVLGYWSAWIYYSHFDATWILDEIPEKSILMYSVPSFVAFIVCFLAACALLLKNVFLIKRILDDPEPDESEATWAQIGKIWGLLIALVLIMKFFENFALAMLVAGVLLLACLFLASWLLDKKKNRRVSFNHFRDGVILFSNALIFVGCISGYLGIRDRHPDESKLPKVNFGEKRNEEIHRLLISIGGKLYLANLSEKPVKIVVIESSSEKIKGIFGVTSNGNSK